MNETDSIDIDEYRDLLNARRNINNIKKIIITADGIRHEVFKVFFSSKKVYEIF